MLVGDDTGRAMFKSVSSLVWVWAVEQLQISQTVMNNASFMVMIFCGNVLFTNTKLLHETGDS